MSSTARGGLVSAGILLGAGLGGFVDGILLHQLLQWHNMMSGIVPPVDLVSMKYNMVWDGIFHVLAWLITALGVVRLWTSAGARDVPGASRTLAGSFAIGWGVFNFFEGLIDHEILGIHHVRPGPAWLAWDLGFLVSGLLLIGAGWLSIPRSRAAAARA